MAEGSFTLDFTQTVGDTSQSLTLNCDLNLNYPDALSQAGSEVIRRFVEGLAAIQALETDTES